MGVAEFAETGVVGREAELAAVFGFVTSSEPGPAALVVEGEAGMGKTTLVRAALARAAGAEMRVFTARPAAGEVELPYVGLADLLAGVTQDFVAALPPAQRTAVEAALAREGSTVAVDPHALARAVLELLRSEAASGRLVLVVDDMQWLDRPTVAALSFAFRRIGALPLRVLAAARTDGGPLRLPFGLEEWKGVRRLELSGLPATELGALLRNRLGVQLPRPRLEALWRAAGGNPMFALEVARSGGRATSLPTLSVALAERLRALDAGARAAAMTAAAALRPSADLVQRAGVTAKELRSALEAEILELDGEWLSFTHPLLASAAYELLLPDERRELHARLAAASRDTIERGHHIARSAEAPDESAAATIERAAEQASALGDRAGASAFWLRAAELSDDPNGIAAQSREVRAAAELELAGDIEAAYALAARLTAELPAGVARARARQIRVSCWPGSVDEGIAELGRALDDAAGDDLALAELHLAATELSGVALDMDSGEHHARMAIELAERCSAQAIAATALGFLGMFDCLSGKGVTEAARLAYAIWDGTFAGRTAYSPRMALGFSCLHAGAFDEAERLFEEEVALAHERGWEPLEVIGSMQLVWAQRRAGRWAEALAGAREAYEHARQAAEPQVVNASSFELAQMYALLGRHEEARTISTDGLPVAEASGDFWSLTAHRTALGLIAIAEDDPEVVVEALEPAWDLMLLRRLGELSIFPVAQVLGEALVALGRLDEALEVAAELRSSPGGGRPWSRAMAWRCEALVASARGDHVVARTAIGAALEAHSELPEPFEHARALHLAGRIERRARSWGAARRALLEALERFDTLGAARWAEKAAADIAGLPGRRPAGETALTNREHEIAELVADGLANKEVAARLFVSVRTVEATLTKVYEKLGVRSRTELARRLDRP